MQITFVGSRRAALINIFPHQPMRRGLHLRTAEVSSYLWNFYAISMNSFCLKCFCCGGSFIAIKSNRFT